MKDDALLQAEFVRLMGISGWSGAEAARQLRLSESAVSQYRNGDSTPSPTVLKLFKMLVGDAAPIPGDSAAMILREIPPDYLLDDVAAVSRRLRDEIEALDRAIARLKARTALQAAAKGSSKATAKSKQ